MKLRVHTQKRLDMNEPPASRTFYRIVRTNPPTGSDFLTQQERGVPRPQSDDAEVAKLAGVIPA